MGSCKHIKYICFYNSNESEIKRTGSLAAVNKINYIVECLNAIGYNVSLISPSWIVKKSFGFYKQQRKYINEGLDVLYTFSFGMGNKFLEVLSKICSLLFVFFYLILFVKRNETIIVYHSLAFGKSIIWAKKLKGFKVLLEVEELYQYCIEMTNNTKNLEYKMIRNADSFIFVSENLKNQVINICPKKYIIINGIYSTNNSLSKKFNDGNIHVIYSGTFDPVKGGAQIAIDTAKELPQNYIIHISGDGSLTEIERLKERVNNVNRHGKAHVVFEGLLDYPKYIKLLQCCHIGLSTQNINDKMLNESCFPSKILTYLSNGLAVVAGRCESIENSKVSSVIQYYECQNAKSIAEAIISTDINRNYTAIVKSLDVEFKKDLLGLLNTLNG